MTIKRVYHFALPYHVSGFEDDVGVEDLKWAGVWDDVPSDIQARMMAGEGFFGGGVTVTAADLDQLPDRVWKLIADKLGLQWEPASVS